MHMVKKLTFNRFLSAYVPLSKMDFDRTIPPLEPVLSSETINTFSFTNRILLWLNSFLGCLCHSAIQI